MRQHLPLRKLKKACNGGLGDVPKGVMGQKGLVAGHDDVRKGQQTGKRIVADDVGGMILEKQGGLLLVDVDGEEADLPLLQRLHDGGRVDERTPAGIDEEDAVLHGRDGGRIDHVMGRGHEGHVKGEDVRVTEQLFPGVDVGGCLLYTSDAADE